MSHWLDDVPEGSHIIVLPPGDISGFRIDGKEILVMAAREKHKPNLRAGKGRLEKKYTRHEMVETALPGSTVTITYDIDL